MAWGGRAGVKFDDSDGAVMVAARREFVATDSRRCDPANRKSRLSDDAQGGNAPSDERFLREKQGRRSSHFCKAASG